MQKAQIHLGEGVLTWEAYERRSDRYGCVYLMGEGGNSLSTEIFPSKIAIGTAEMCSGKRGQLIAVVKETRRSTHIGDLFRGVAPVTPEVGEIISLGTGLFFVNGITGTPGAAVGLRPEDGRPSDWLDIKALYRAHEQTVELFFIPQAA